MNSLVIRFSGFPERSSSKGKLCLIIVVIFIGLGRAYRLGGGRGLKVSNERQVTKGWTIFMEEADPSRLGKCRRARLDEMFEK